MPVLKLFLLDFMKIENGVSHSTYGSHVMSVTFFLFSCMLAVYFCKPVRYTK